MQSLAATARWSRLGQVNRVVTALIFREMKTRFGKTRFGYFWAIGEPAIYILFFVAIRTFISDNSPFGESAILFMLSGLVAVRVFTNIASTMLAAVSANRSLLAYPPVKPVDVITARFVLETMVSLVLILIFFSMLPLVVEYEVIVNFQTFVASVAAIVLLGAGFGTFNAVVSILVPSWERVWTILRLPVLILSGVFYVPTALPPYAQEVLWYNPVLHCVEWMRVGTYLSYDPLLDRSYVLAVGMGLLTVGLGLERVYRYRILAA